MAVAAKWTARTAMSGSFTLLSGAALASLGAY
jgi:hypothetical protein